jgi:hypothetical protein
MCVIAALHCSDVAGGFEQAHKINTGSPSAMRAKLEVIPQNLAVAAVMVSSFLSP